MNTGKTSLMLQIIDNLNAVVECNLEHKISIVFIR